MGEVFFKKADYEYETLRPIVFNMIEALAGNLIKEDTRVLLKPNLLLAAEPEKAIITHPNLVKAVAEYVISKGGILQISDSPAIGSFEKIIITGGYKKAFQNIDVLFKEFELSKPIYIGKPFGEIDIAVDAVETDVVINLPKLKTHAQMLLTLGVKNLFGCIIGYRKPEWHFRTGINRELFAKLLVLICNAIKPSITIVDGILALEGDGPGKKGTPKKLGLLIGSRNPFAIDAAICSMLGMEYDRLPTNRAAKKLGLLSQNLSFNGDFVTVNDFILPDLGNLTFGPKYLHGITRRYLIKRPVPDNRICKLCGECWKICPPEAITLSKEKICIDYDKCIRCYCCIEICPHAAISVKETIPGKILKRFLKKREAK